MAKAHNSVIGIDIGRYALKSVLLQRKSGNRVALTHYGSHVPTKPPRDADTLGKELKALLRDMGGSAKACVVSVSSPDALIRIIEQPETPTHLLRDALRLNGFTLLNQDVKSFVLDCDRIETAVPIETEPGTTPQKKYLVGGLPRNEVQQLNTAAEAASLALTALQLSPVSIFNAFEFARPEEFNNEAFFLVDIGHISSTMMVGVRRELALVRSIDFGGKALMEALTALSTATPSDVIEGLEEEDELMVEYSRVALNTLSREVGSSIGFFEARHEKAISRIYVSGGPAKSKTILKLMSEEIGIPCEAWSAVDACENALTGARKEEMARESIDLNAACGAAAELLKGS
jgi:Tfp pilus assembly PilM family ATPase